MDVAALDQCMHQDMGKGGRDPFGGAEGLLHLGYEPGWALEDKGMLRVNRPERVTPQLLNALQICC